MTTEIPRPAVSMRLDCDDPSAAPLLAVTGAASYVSPGHFPRFAQERDIKQPSPDFCMEAGERVCVMNEPVQVEGVRLRVCTL